MLGGGCSGYQYKFGFDARRDPAEDVLVERDGARLVVDKVSLDLLAGSEIDYSESLMEAGFKVNNPNASSSWRLRFVVLRLKAGSRHDWGWGFRARCERRCNR